ncbi:MAG TPA: superinfection immunity protein [Actinomycetota bacterium]|nr:superinfection immunity protein [Actinomycetota bacterium]
MSAGNEIGVGILFLACFYFIPIIVGAIRKVPNIGSIIVVNLFLGWTLIGWVVALAMAARTVPPPVRYQDEALRR